MEKKQFIPSAEQIAEGIEIANKLGHSGIIVNCKGEYFTSRNLALLSVGQDETKIAKIDLAANAAQTASIAAAPVGDGGESAADQPGENEPSEEQPSGENIEEQPAETSATAEGASVKKGSRKRGTAK